MRAFRLAVGTFVVQAKDIRAEQFDADAIVNVVNQVDANGPLALQGSVEGDPFKKTGRELRRIKEDDSGERLGFLSKVEGAEGSRTLNGSDLFSIPRQLGVQSSSPLNAHESSQPPEDQGPTSSFQPQEHPPRPTARESSIPSNTPRVFGPEDQTVVPEEDNCAICLDPKNEEVCAPFRCATVEHSFCKSCIDSWILHRIRQNPTCPCCRSDLKLNSPYDHLRPTQQERMGMEGFGELLTFGTGLLEAGERMGMEGFGELLAFGTGLLEAGRRRREEAEAQEREEELHINPDLEAFATFARGIRRFIEEQRNSGEIP